MTGDSRQSAARRWEVGAAWLGAVLATAGIALAVATAVPPALENLSSRVADGVTPVELGGGAEVVVPADWIVTNRGEDAVAVRTPDGALRAELDVADEDATAVLGETPGVVGGARSEQLASGMSATHADLADGGYVAVVAGAEGGSTVRVIIEMSRGDLAAYRPAIADLLEGIRA